MKTKTLFSAVGAFTLAAMLVSMPILGASPQDSTTKDSTAKKTKKSTEDATTQADQAVSSDAKSAKSTVTGKASQSEIDAAKASGKVWVNTGSGVYHKGGQYYGNTKQGKFMTEQDAAKAGYRAAKSEKTK